MIDLKALRTANDLTQQQLADKIHCARTVIANIESGLSQPSISTAKGIGQVLDFDWWLFFEDGGTDYGSDSIYCSGSCEASEN